MDYNKHLHNFGFDYSGNRPSTIKRMLHNEFPTTTGFHDRFHKNQSTIVYNTSAGGSYVEAAIHSWGISDEQLLNNVARRLKNKLNGQTGLAWPPHINELEDTEQPNDLLRKFL